jgi:hypothetical protein
MKKKNTVIILGNQHLSVKIDQNLNHGINIKYKVKKKILKLSFICFLIINNYFHF